MSDCLCGGAAWATCCGPLLAGERQAGTAEELMRSRYSAFVVGDGDYLWRTWHPATRPESVKAHGVEWTGLTVVDESGQVAGILSELDCIKGVLNAIYNEGDPEHALVRDAMCTEVVSCAPGDNIVEVAQAMLDSRQRRRPVIENGRLVGQVSSNNILWALMEHSRRKIFNRSR